MMYAFELACMSWYCMCPSKKCMWLNTDIIMLSTQGMSTYSSMEENDGASSCDGREYVHSNSEEGKGH